MSLSHEIRQYLADGFFTQGLNLLARVPGTALAQIQQFQGYLGQSYVPSAIEDQLKALLLPHAAAVSNGPFIPPPVSNELPQVALREPGQVKGTFWGDLFSNNKQLPLEITELRTRAIKLHKQQAHVHPLIMAAAREGDQKKAFTLASILMEEVIPELDKIYSAAREWDSTGQLPVSILRNEVVKDTVDKMKRIKYCTERMSRIRSFLKKGRHKRKKQLVSISPADRQAYQMELDTLRLEQMEICQELGLAIPGETSNT